MNFDALVFDLDGTAVPKQPDGLPSPRLIRAVHEAKKVCHVSVATGRPLELCKHILDALDIDDLCVVNDGSQLYSRKSQQFVWKQEMDTYEVNELIGKLQPFGQYYVSDEKMLAQMPTGTLHLDDLSTFPYQQLSEYHHTEPVGSICILAVSQQDAVKIISLVKESLSFRSLVMGGWKAGTFNIYISHELATKKHGLQSLLARLNVQVDKVMVAGDGANDIPLFELAGWKIAMGNASQELKDLADWVAPDVEEDGLAVAIEKFILKKQV